MGLYIHISTPLSHTPTQECRKLLRMTVNTARGLALAMRAADELVLAAGAMQLALKV